MGEGEEGEVEIRANQLISCTAPFSAFHSVSVNVKEGKEVQATDPCTAFHQRGALAQPCGHNTIVRDVGGGGTGTQPSLLSHPQTRDDPCLLSCPTQRVPTFSSL